MSVPAVVEGHNFNQIIAASALRKPRRVVGQYILLNHQSDPKFLIPPHYKGLCYCVPTKDTVTAQSIKVAAVMNKQYWQTKAEIDIHSRVMHLDGVAHPICQQSGTFSHFMIFNLYPKGDLFEYMRENELEPWQQDWIAYSIAFTLMQFHELDIVVHDLKCENILVESDAASILHSKFIDFGMAYHEPSTKKADKIRTYGTWAYNPPEVFQLFASERSAFPSSFPQDLWQLGVILYTLAAQEEYLEKEDDKDLGETFVKTLKIPVFRDCSHLDLGSFSQEVKDLLNQAPEKRPPASWVAKRMADIFLRAYPNSPVTEKVRNRPLLTLDQVVDILRVVNVKLGGTIASKIASYLPATAIGLENPKLTLDHVLLRLQSLVPGLVPSLDSSEIQKVSVDQVVDRLKVVKTKLGGTIASKIASYLPATAIGLENPKLTLDHVLLRLQSLGGVK